MRAPKLIRALGLAVFISGALATPALAVPQLQPNLTNEPETLAKTDEGMFYKVSVKNTAPQDPEVGDTLTCQNSMTYSVSYQWLRNGAVISGETSNTYVTTAADEGQGIQCRVTGTNPNGRAVLAQAKVVSTAGSKILTLTETAGAPLAVGQIVDGFGIPQGATIVAINAGSLELSAASTFSYSNTLIRTFDPTPVSLGSTAVSLPPIVVNPQPATLPPLPATQGSAALPTISGAIPGDFASRDGEKLTCKAPSNWTPGSTFTYQWLRNGAPIPGATSTEYTPVEAEDKYAVMQCEVTITGGSGAPPDGGVAVATSGISYWALIKPITEYETFEAISQYPRSNEIPVASFSSTAQDPITLEVELPSGSETFPFEVKNPGIDWSCKSFMPSGLTPGKVICMREGTLGPGESTSSLEIITHLGEDAPDVGIATATVSGGGGPSASDTAQYTFTPGLGFGVLAGSFKAKVSDQFGNDDTKAGGHPFSAFETFGLNIHKTVIRTVEPTEQVKDVVVKAPRGFVGNAVATPEYCKEVEEVLLGTCPAGSAIGGIYIHAPILGSNGEKDPFPTEPLNGIAYPIYSIEPEFGQPAQFAFAATSNAPYTFIPELRPEEGYAISFRTAPIIQIPRLFGNELFLCGFGAKLAPSPEGAEFKACRKPTEAGANPEPLITNPTRCSGSPPATGLQLDSWQHPEDIKTYDFTAPQITGCEEVEFEPEAELVPTNRQADSPTGLGVEITIPSEGIQSNTGVSQANLDTAKITFPEGMTINAAAAEGLSACTLAQVKLHSNAADECPSSSRVGQIEIETPLIRETLHGSIYLAAQNDNPFNSTLGLYMVFSSARDGVTVKVAGKVVPDPATGQLVSTFTENPEWPFSRLALHFNQGPRAPLVNPPKCGTYAIRAEFSPWSAANPANPTPDEIVTDNSKYKVTQGPNGAPCPDGNLTPKLKAGLTDPTAGAKSPFVLSLSREDGSQRFTALDIANPKGLTAYLKGIDICPDSALATVSPAEGAGSGEIAHPSCPANSLVGTAEAGAGSGPDPFYVKTGKVYLAGPYKGAPISLAIITPAVAGPYDLGNVLVRTPLYIDPTSAQVRAVSDPIPTALHGIALDIRDIRVALNRPHFTAAPTNCEASSVDATVTGEAGATAKVSNRFQVGGCENLGFKPKLSFRLFGGTKRGAHPKFRATLTPRPGDANLAAASVALPHSEFLDQAHIKTVCTRVQFAAGQCPAGSIYGEATATTPILDGPVSGPVYLRSSSNQLPDLVVALKGPDTQPIEIEVAGRIDSINGGIRSSFEVVPDQPVSSFTLTMRGCKKGLLVNSRDLCATGKAARATARLVGQNAKSLETRPKLKNACPKARKAKKSKRHKKHGR